MTDSNQPMNRQPWPEHLLPVQRIKGMISQFEAGALYDFARAASTGCIVEVGSYRGRSTAALALGTRAGAGLPVFAVDPHEAFTGVKGGEFGAADRAAFFRNMLRTGTYEEVRLVNLSSEVITPGWTLPVSLLWIDGDHSYDGVRRDFECWSPHLTPDATVMFDDVNVEGPRRLTDELVASGGWQIVNQVGKTRALHASG